MLEIDPRGKVRLSMRVVDQETGAELEDTRPAREERPRGEGRGDRGPRRDGDRGRPPRSDGGGGRGDGVIGEGRGPRRDGDGRRDGDRRQRSWPAAASGSRTRAAQRSVRTDDDGPAPEFAPAFLTGDRD